MTALLMLRRGAALALPLALIGCSALRPADREPGEKMAIVKAGSWGKVYRGGYVEMVSVNGLEPHWRIRSEMEVEAGELAGLFYVYLCDETPKHCRSVAEAQVPFRAEAGHTYQVRAREQVNGSNRFWVWVEDIVTGKPVGGDMPDRPAT